MALIVTEGIVLRTLKYSDNTVICNILTPGHGVISVIASRGSKSSSALMNYLRVMNVLTMTIYPAKNNGLHRVKEVNFAFVYKTLNADVVRSLYGFVITETVYLIQKVNTTETDSLFYFLKNRLIHLEESITPGLGSIAEGLKEIIAIEGITPDHNYSESNCFFNVSEGTYQSHDTGGNYTFDANKSKLLAELFIDNRFNFTDYQITEITDCLYWYISAHIPLFKTPKSWLVLKEMR